LTLGVHAIALLPAGVIGAPAEENRASGDVGRAGDDDHGGSADSCVGAAEDDHGESIGSCRGAGHGMGVHCDGGGVEPVQLGAWLDALLDALVDNSSRLTGVSRLTSRDRSSESGSRLAGVDRLIGMDWLNGLLDTWLN
jgi:hypothetical protein